MRRCGALAVLAALSSVAAAVREGGEGGGAAMVQHAGKVESNPVEGAVAFNEDGFDPAHVLTYFIAPGEEECFYHVVQGAAESLRVAFFVSSGGNLKLDATFKGPSDASVYDKREVDEDLVEFVAEKEGTYAFCFDNHRGSESRTMTFALHVGDRPSTDPLALPEHMEPLGAQVGRLRDAIDDVSTQLSLHAARLKRHISTQASTEARITWFTVAESGFIVFLSVAQALLVRYFLSNRQWV